MIAIIGAGISGLTLAAALEKKQKPYLLFEGSQRIGGNLFSKKWQDKYLIECGANSLLADDFILDFIKKIGLEAEMVRANPVSKNRYILKKGRYHKLPTSPPALLTSSFFSFKTKLKILSEFFYKNKIKSETNEKIEPAEFETLATFFARHFGKEVVEYAVNPFVGGIYAGKAEELLLSLTFPQLKEMERQYGSILKGFIKNKAAERKTSLSFKGGMQRLAEALKDQLSPQSLLLQTPITGIEYDLKSGKFRVKSQNTLNYKAESLDFQPNKNAFFSTGENEKEELRQNEIEEKIEENTKENTEKTWEVTQVVLTTSAQVTAQILKGIDFGSELQQKCVASLREGLEKLHYPPMNLVHSVFKKSDFGNFLSGSHQLDGFGALHPPIENPFSAGSIWSSSVFEGRAPEDEVLLTSFVGGRAGEKQAQQGEAAILADLNRELKAIYQLKNPPLYQHLHHWEKAIPQYDAKMWQVWQAAQDFEQTFANQFFICANWYKGVSVSDCIKKATALAARL
ncbi:protoporphyrinogen oxidase [Hugenholtzia roseola]|uniref:protoporphyrinogen oxidase n=1 Tax=Hugenholtzia roseola TaxID=1002 RepID=UPI00054FFAE4|nr:protoporphyrinogen oxidase [Hugenholtzia roseola]